MQLKSELLKHLPVSGVVFLLTMQEFEIASLLQIPAWTVHLFDAQAGGLMPAGTFRTLVLPVLAQSAVLLPVVWCVLVNVQQAPPRWRIGDAESTSACWPGILVACAATILLWIVPLSVVSWSGFPAMMDVLRNEILVRSTLLDLGAALAISLPCAVLSLVVARRLRPIALAGGEQRRAAEYLSSAATILAMVPGLFGALSVSMAVLFALQHPPLTELRSTLWPMAVALILFLIPRAFLLTLLVPSRRNLEACHLAAMLRASADHNQRQSAAGLEWWYEARPMFVVAVVLFYWSLANLTAAALLCPPTIPLLSFEGNIVPLPVRLYKFIHQGRTATLSLMALLSVVAPLLLVVLVSWIAPRLYERFSAPRTSHS